MAQKTKAVLKAFFETGDKPTQQQFSDWLDSYVHKDDSISVDKVAGLDDMLTELALKSDLTTHINDDVAHVTQEDHDNWNGKADLSSVYTQDAINTLLNDKADKAHIHIAEMKVSPTGADEEANSIRLRPSGAEALLEMTANGTDWVVLKRWSLT